MATEGKLTGQPLIHFLEKFDPPLFCGHHFFHTFGLQSGTSLSPFIITFRKLVRSVHLLSISFGLKHLGCALLQLFFMARNKLRNLGLLGCFQLRHLGVVVRFQLRQFGSTFFLNPVPLPCKTWFG